MYHILCTSLFTISNAPKTLKSVERLRIVYSARLLKAVLNFRSREPWATLRMATRTGRTRPLEHETGKGKL